MRHTDEQRESQAIGAKGVSLLSLCLAQRERTKILHVPHIYSTYTRGGACLPIVWGASVHTHTHGEIYLQ